MPKKKRKCVKYGTTKVRGKNRRVCRRYSGKKKKKR